MLMLFATIIAGFVLVAYFAFLALTSPVDLVEGVFEWPIRPPSSAIEAASRGRRAAGVGRGEENYAIIRTWPRRNT